MKSFVPKALVAIFVACMLPMYWIAFKAPAVGFYHDDGIYLVTAKALAEGRGYRIISLPDGPPQTKYPILFPAVLSVAWKIFPNFPDNALFLKTIPLLSAILWLWLSYRLIREETGSHDVALWIVLLTAASSEVVFFSTTFMSETFFACFATGALIWLKRLEGTGSGERGGWPLFLSTGLVAASFLTRTVGVPLVAAGAVSLFHKRKYVPCLMYLFGFAILAAPWFWWQAIYSALGNATDSYYTLSNYKSWNILFHFTAEQKLHVVLMNLFYIICYPIYFIYVKNSAVSFFISIVFVLLVLSGFVRDIYKSVRSLNLFIFFHFCLLVMWVWPPRRFILPILPLLLLYSYKEFSRICDRISPSGTVRTYASLVAVVLLGTQLIYGLVVSTGETIRRQAVSFAPLKHPLDDWKGLRDLFDWIRQNTPPDSILLGSLDPTYYLYTGRKAVRGFDMDPYLLFYSRESETALGDVPDIVQRIVTYRVNYIIRTPSMYFKGAMIFNGIIDQLMSRYPEALHLVKEGSDPSYKIYEVDRGKLLQALP